MNESMEVTKKMVTAETEDGSTVGTQAGQEARSMDEGAVEAGGTPVEAPVEVPRDTPGESLVATGEMAIPPTDDGRVTEAQAAAIAHAVSVAVDTALAEQISISVSRAVSAAVSEAMASGVAFALEQAVAEAERRTRERTLVEATEQAEGRLLGHIRACGQRPTENGVGGGGSGVRMHPLVHHLTRKERAALAGRAQRGETVLL